MNKRSVRQKQLKDKENQPNNEEKKSKDQRTFYLIVEAAAASFSSNSPPPNRSQYWLISSKDIVDVPIINNDTVYTGKQLQFRGKDQRVFSGTCVLFSPDFPFVQAQFSQITSTASMDTHSENRFSGNAGANAVSVLTNSTKANILVSGKTRNSHVKLPSVITLKSIKREVDTSDHMMEIPELGDPDAENKPPGAPPAVLTLAVGKAMTFDQQSQTDSKMYDTVVPATASQMHQQSSQLAQLIRANNGLVQEVKTLKESTKDIRQIVEDMNSKVDRAIALLLSRSREDSLENITATQQQQQHLVDVSYTDDSVVAESHVTTNGHDVSIDHYSISYSNSSTGAPSREQSVARSENTPPLKKNKAKLNNSIKMAAQQQQQQQQQQQIMPTPLADEDYTTIGVNGTRIPKNVLQGLNYENHSSVTRKILAGVFDRDTLASHSLTGKPSPAFLDRGAKMQLDSMKIADIVSFIASKCLVSETSIRGVITSKCADENKMKRLHAKKRQSMDVEMTEPANKRRTTHN